MKPETQLLKSVWKNEAEITFSDTEIALDHLNLDQMISSAFCSGPFYYYVIDFNSMGLSHVSPSIRDIHRLDPQSVTFQDILDQIHPDDMEFVSRAEERCIDIVFRKTPPEKRKNYKKSYCCRFKTADGSYRLFNHQAIMLSVDDQGRLSKCLNIHTDISHLTSCNNQQVSIIGMLGEPSYLNIDVDTDEVKAIPSSSLFSKREKEVIQLLTQGQTSSAIAKALFISENTVKNHRKNILKKSGCKNVSQMIAKCITEGLL